MQTFTGTPILKLSARDPDPVLAQRSAQAATDVLLERAKNEIGISSLQLTQLDRPVVATDPVFPRTRLALAVALLIGLALGIGLALLRETLTTKVETPEELGRVSEAPVYGEIPTEPAIASFNAPEVLGENPLLRGVSEALRELRTNLLFSEGSLTSVVVTSPEGSHGKTTVRSVSPSPFARAGTGRCSIDADLRRGRLSELLDVERSPGPIGDPEGTQWRRSIRHTSLDNLDFITGGRRGDDPGELLTSEFPNLLDRSEGVRHGVIDTTPLVPISDARIIARYANA